MGGDGNENRLHLVSTSHSERGGAVATAHVEVALVRTRTDMAQHPDGVPRDAAAVERVVDEQLLQWPHRRFRRRSVARTKG